MRSERAQLEGRFDAGRRLASDPMPAASKRIAILGSRGIPARYGGFETFAEELAARLADAGHEVSVFCEGRGGPATHRGARLVHVAVPRLGPLSALVYDALCLWKARRGYDVVYMLGYGAALFCGWPRRSGTELWINLDGREWKRAKWGWLARTWLRAMERRALRVADRLVFDSAAVQSEVVGPADDPRASVIAYGAELDSAAAPVEMLSGLGLASGTYDLVVARLEPENHVLEILEGVRLSGSARPLAVVGDLAGPYAQRCERAAAAPGGPRVEFLGSIWDRSLLTTLRRHACVYVHGHGVGGTNPSLLEALAEGCVVVAHENPYNREVLGELGTYFSDAPGLAEELRRVERLPAEERARSAAAGRARIAERYSWERIARLYMELLAPSREVDRQATPGAHVAPPPALPARERSSATAAGNARGSRR